MEQLVLTTADRTSASGWQVSVSDNWDVLGPFPIHAREQHFLSPSYPLNLYEEIDYTAHWSSSYADNGEVGWTKVKSVNGTLGVSFPQIRWGSLRAFEGWAALQHHTVLRTSITIYPPSAERMSSEALPRLLIDVKQGSFFTVLPSWESHPDARASSTPSWYAGNIYSMNAAPAQAVRLPVPPSTDVSTSYDLFISGDYEIRLFGDPTVRDSDVPELLVDFSVDIETGENLEPLPSHHVVPDFVIGWAFGQVIGIGLHSTDGWWVVKRATLARSYTEAIEVELLEEMSIAPTQTRVIPILIGQTEAFRGPNITVELSVISLSSLETVLSVTLPIKQAELWDESHYQPIIASYIYGTSTPTAFVAIPPKYSNENARHPPLLSLHGAGVDILGHILWDCAPSRHQHSWVIAPTGRTAWGLDWHGPSTQDALATVGALSTILSHLSLWRPWRFLYKTRVVILGHSNGGQGAWYTASRYPDKVIAAIPAAAYIKSQAYIPLVQSRAAHFIDPGLRSILESSLTPDDNDLFLSNLVDTPVLAVHGGDDENVPVWHSRALVDTLKTWRKDANVTFQEDAKQTHCYATVFDNERVQSFIDRSIAEMHATEEEDRPWRFTLTVAVPLESGSFHGWRIHNLETPGRLARLTVEEKGDTVFVNSRNVHAFSISTPRKLPPGDGEMFLSVDGEQFRMRPFYDGGPMFLARRNDKWELPEELPVTLQLTGRMSLILSSRAPLLLVISDRTDRIALDAALRLAHNLNIYHKLDSSIVDAAEAITLVQERTLSQEQNVVVIGGLENSFARHCLAQPKTAFHLKGDILHLRNRPLGQDHAATFLHPHPTSTDALMLFAFAYNAVGLERILRLFPIRTGVTVPDWIVLSSSTNVMGAGGVTAAGVWGVNWSWNEGMSSF